MIAKLSAVGPALWVDVLRVLWPVLGLVGGLGVCHGAEAGEVAHGHGLLWEIERPGYWPSYVFGTMHSDDQRVLSLPLPVKAHFDKAADLVVEAKFGPEGLGRTGPMKKLVFTDGRRLSKLLDPMLYHRTIEAMRQSGYPRPLVELMKPWAISTVLTLPRPTTGMFLDMYLIAEARRQAKPVHGLETVDEQLQTLESLSLAEQKAMLAEALNRLPGRGRLQERLTRAYLDRDLERLLEIGYESLDPRGVTEGFAASLIDNRNLRMIDRLQPLLRRGKVFIAVGALHLPGDNGILALLEARGYRVTPLY